MLQLDHLAWIPRDVVLSESTIAQLSQRNDLASPCQPRYIRFRSRLAIGYRTPTASLVTVETVLASMPVLHGSLRVHAIASVN